MASVVDIRSSTTPESRGQIAYTAYCRKVDFKAHNGDDLPRWANLPAAVREAWIHAAGVIWELGTTGVARM
jgi:hypothetical protein